jgi:hypothetical protein
MMTTKQTTELKDQALTLLHERDMRFYDGTMVVATAKTAGEMVRLLSREPLLDEQGAATLVEMTERYAIPAWSEQDLAHFIYCAKMCPRKVVEA